MKIMFYVVIFFISKTVFAELSIENYKISDDKKSVIYTSKLNKQEVLPILEKCGNPPSGVPEIFKLIRKGDDIFAAFGKCVATIKTLKNNKIECSGCD